MSVNFFNIDTRSLVPEAWGDYGEILQQGMAWHSPRVNGKLALERTGPYIPPITLPGFSMVITDAARTLLESSGLTGFTFLPVEKKLIVELHWETWDLSADEPGKYPESGEPENYIPGKPHSPTVAIAMGELWELVVPINVKVLRPTPTVSSYKDLRIDLSTWNGADLLKGEDYGGILFSQRAKDWFAERWSQYVTFNPFSAA